jgi:porin
MRPYWGRLFSSLSLWAIVIGPASATAGQAQDCQRLDSMFEPKWAIQYLPVCDSILQDIDGWRSTLADYGVATRVRYSAILTYDLLQNNRPAAPQAYNGQKTTFFTAPVVDLTVDLGRWGLDNAKLSVSGTYGYASFDPIGPTAAKISNLTYYQSFLNRAIEVKFGFTTNYNDWVGVLTGGSPVLATGLSSLVPVEAGLSVDPGPTPAFSVRFNATDGWYFQSGVQRSISALGQIYEVQHGGIGLNFNSARASALFLNEAGLKRDSTPGGPSIWLRGGVLYNASDYTRFVDGGYSKNYSVYALGDFQISQINRSAPYRGIFAGFTAEYAPPDVNLYSQYYEARLYSIGLLDARPGDGMTLSVNYSAFSHSANIAYAEQGITTPAEQIQVTASYAAHLAQGVYLTPSLSYIKHPAFGQYRDALLGQLTLYTNW